MGWIAGGRSNCVGGGPLPRPRPRPPRSFLTERGEFGRATDSLERGAGAPSGLALLAHLPQNCWGRLGVPLGSRLDDGDRAPSEAGSLSRPLPSFLGERGEFDPLRTVRRARHLPARFAGEGAGRGGGPPSRTTSSEPPHTHSPSIPSPGRGRGCEPERAGERPRRRSSIPALLPHSRTPALPHLRTYALTHFAIPLPRPPARTPGSFA
jgi:hypothetical protein